MRKNNQHPDYKQGHTNDDTLRLALEVAQLGFWDHDIVADSITRSPEWGTMLGYSEDEVVGKMNFWLDHIHPDDRPEVDRWVKDHESGKQKSFRIEHRLRTKDGQWKWILNWGKVTERDAEGNPLRALGFHLDITERKQIEAALAQADKLSTMGTLAGGIAHDFNNLLTVIRGNLQLARETKDAELRDGYLAKAEQATRRSQELTNRLLTFTHGGAPTLDPLDLEQVIVEARDLVMSGSRSRVQIECESALPPVAGCKGHLGQVFQNLLLNACQAVPDGGIITVTCFLKSIDTTVGTLLDPGDYVEVIVSDQGPGIPEDLVGNVFDPFFSTRPEGKGLGLATAHSIVQDHNGMLEVLPCQSGGAHLRVLLPVAGKDLLDREALESPGMKVEGEGRILVVDDDEMVRDLATAVVERLGYRTVETDDGAKAAEIYKEALGGSEPFRAVLMDLTIPGGTGGKDAVARILAADPAARVIVTSGYSDDPVMAKFREYGFRARLAKPYELDEVREALADVLAED